MILKEKIKALLKKWLNIGPETIEDFRKRGVKIGEGCALVECRIDYGHGYLIEIGDNVGMSFVTFLAHDASVKFLEGALTHSKIGRIKVGNNVFVGYGSIILPGTTIGNNVLIGAGSVVKGNIPDNSVMTGNPLQYLCSTDEYMARNIEKFKKGPIYNTDFHTISEEQKAKMIRELDGVMGFDL